jgi:acyl-CoA reductase-like NAD-dependent aldehyde dehydrogenase
MREARLFLAGARREGARTVDVSSPYDQSPVTQLHLAGPEQLVEAADSVVEAAPAVAALTPLQRATILGRARKGIDARRDELVDAIVEEAGKPLKLARVEVDRCRDTLLAAADVARYPQTEARDLGGFGSGTGSTALIKRVPIGPILAISPFNFPLNLVAHKLAPAIAAGCPVLLKPASQTPSPALLLAEILSDAGLPAGALSVMPCRGSDVAPLVDDDRIKLLTFTGSQEVGWGLKQRAWRKRVTLELGGNAAVLIEPDGGDLGEIARTLASAAYGYAGQSCISVQRILVHRSCLDELRGKLAAEVEALPYGNPADEATVCGPLIDAGEAERIESWISRAIDAGGRAVVGGQREGSVVRPTLLEDVPKDEPVVAEEVFGPVAVLDGYDDFEQGLAMANDSPYGLQAGIYTQDVGKIRQAWDVLEVGGLIQGGPPTWRCDPMPYGGAKDSGVGREGPSYAYLEMTEERLLVLR